MATHYSTASSLDGFIATDGHSLDWLLSRDIDAAGPHHFDAYSEGIGALVMGASTYEWLLREIGDGEWPYSKPVWVLSHRALPVVEGADVRFAGGDGESADITAVHAAAVAAADELDVWVMGGGPVAAQFADAGLLDEMWVQLAPVTLGSGAPLMPTHVELELVEVVRNRDFACTRYRVVR